jgi:hypothetical protein
VRAGHPAGDRSRSSRRRDRWPASATTFLIALGFGRWAPRNFDPLAARPRQRLEKGRKL